MRYDIRIFFSPIFPDSLVQPIFFLPFHSDWAILSCSPILALVKSLFLFQALGVVPFDSQSFRYLHFFRFFFIQLGGIR